MKLSALTCWTLALGLMPFVFADTTCNTLEQPTLIPSLPPITSKQLNASFSGGWINSGNFDGWGGALRMGVLLNEHHCFECEVDYFGMTQNADLASNRASTIPDTTEQLILNSHNVINEVPLFVNYRYQRSCSNYPMGFYLGGGLGVNISALEATGSLQENFIIDGEIEPASTTSINRNATKVYPAGQLFLGIGGRLNNNFGLYLGGRMVATQKLKFVDSSGTFGTIGSTDALQWIAEATLVFTW